MTYRQDTQGRDSNNDQTATEIEIEGENDSVNRMNYNSAENYDSNFDNNTNIMSPSDDYTQQQNTVIKYASNSMSRDGQPDEVDQLDLNIPCSSNQSMLIKSQF